MNLRILAKNVTLSRPAKDRLERRLYFALGRFLHRIKSVDVTLRDDNGPRGGVDKCCRILVKSRGAKDVVVEGRGDRLSALIDRTADRAGRAVARALDVRPWDHAVAASGNVRRRRTTDTRPAPVSNAD